MTDPKNTDTDDGGVDDGDEDLNFNGYQDAAGFLFGLVGLAVMALRRRRG